MKFDLSAILDKVRDALSGEPVRFIAYGSALVVVGVVALANSLGITRFGADLSLTDALVGSTAAVATLGALVEAIRKAVYSPATVAESFIPLPSAPTSPADPT